MWWIVFFILLMPILLILGVSVLFCAFVWLLVSIPLAAWRKRRMVR